MNNNYLYLYDKSFLKKVYSLHLKDFFVKIIVLNWQQNPIQHIQGKITSANISINSQSSLRRTANLSMVIDDNYNNITNINSIISINKKVSMQIGILNTTNQYTDYNIIWFPMGVYVVTSVNISHSVTDLILSIQLKDKMCLLNGECGGVIQASTVFDSYYTIDESGQQVISRPTIYQIIREIVNHFGNQQLGKIIISDLDTRIKQVMQWNGDTALYLIQKSNQYFITTNATEYLNKIQDGYNDVLGSPFQYGDDVGYIYTDFTYPGDLISTQGETITSILDKIINVLGNYEYFYDLNGNFVFQQIRNYLNNSQSKYILNIENQYSQINDTEFLFNYSNCFLVPDYVADLKIYKKILPKSYLLDLSKGKSVYEFDDGNLINTFNNSPQYNQIKNDFVVWGKKSVGNVQRPIRYHLAIDEIPEVGNVYQCFGYLDQDDGIIKYHTPLKFKNKNNFPKKGTPGIFYYDLKDKIIYKWDIDDNNNTNYIAIGSSSDLIHVKTKDWRTELYFQGVSAQPFGTQSNYYYAQLKNEWPKMYQIVQGEDGLYYDKILDQIERNPTSIDYFLDIIDSSSQIAEFSVNNIGRRTVVISDDKINCIFQPFVPDVILLPLLNLNENSSDIEKTRKQCEIRGQYYYQLDNNIYNTLSIGGSSNSAYQKIRQLLCQYTSYNENVSISTIPIYHLQPNTRISIKDIDSDIGGDYIINSMSIDLGSSNSMSINATRALQKI